jgi:hypothetical protein
MKSFKILFLMFSLAGIITSCQLNEIDNYGQPNAGLTGRLIDEATGELVQQDIIRGSVIELKEHGYEIVTPQYLIIRNNGNYSNTRLFANTYTVQPVRGNFKVVDAQDVKIKGQTKLDFMVTPYIRVKDAQIVKEGNMIKATFRLEQTSVNNVLKIGLYAHQDPNVGEPMHVARKEVSVNAVADPNQVYTVELDMFSDADLQEGQNVFFRIGALIDVPEAKFNYAQAVRITL